MRGSDFEILRVQLNPEELGAPIGGTPGARDPPDSGGGAGDPIGGLSICGV